MCIYLVKVKVSVPMVNLVRVTVGGRSENKFRWDQPGRSTVSRYKERKRNGLRTPK